MRPQTNAALARRYDCVLCGVSGRSDACRCRIYQVQHATRGQGTVLNIMSDTRVVTHDCVFRFKVDSTSGMKTCTEYPTCSCNSSKYQGLPCNGVLKAMCSDRHVDPYDPSFARPRFQLQNHAPAKEVEREHGICFAARDAAAANTALQETIVQLPHHPAEKVVLLGNAAVPMSTILALESKLHSRSARVGPYVQSLQVFKETWSMIENDKSLQTLFYAGQAALNEQLSARLANRPISNHTGSTTALSDVVALTVGMGTGTRPESSATSAAAIGASGCKRSAPREPEGESASKKPRKASSCQLCKDLGVADSNVGTQVHESCSKCFFNPKRGNKNFRVSFVVEIPGNTPPGAILKAQFPSDNAGQVFELDFKLDADRFPQHKAHRVRVISNSQRWVFSAEYYPRLAELCRPLLAANHAEYQLPQR